MARYVVVVRAEYTIGTLGPGAVFDSREEAENALVDDFSWVADSYGVDEPSNEEELVSLVNEWMIPVDWVIEELHL